MAMIERRRITSEAEWLKWREHDVTASVVGALFGLCPHESIYRLFARASGEQMPHQPDNKMMRRGRDFQQAVANEVQRRHPEWRVRAANVYLRDPALRLGATPDYFISTRDGKRGVLQCKVVNPAIFRQYWTEADAPAWICIQTLTEAMLAKASFGVIAALENDGWNYEHHEYPVPRVKSAETRIRRAVAQFWADVAVGKYPEPDFTRDARLISAMHPHTTPGKSVDLRGDNEIQELLDALAKAKLDEKNAEAKKKEIDARIRAKIGDAEVAIVNGWRVTLKEIKEAVIKEHVRKSYRQLYTAREEPESSEQAA